MEGCGGGRGGGRNENTTSSTLVLGARSASPGSQFSSFTRKSWPVAVVYFNQALPPLSLGGAATPRLRRGSRCHCLCRNRVTPPDQYYYPWRLCSPVLLLACRRRHRLSQPTSALFISIFSPFGGRRYATTGRPFTFNFRRRKTCQRWSYGRRQLGFQEEIEMVTSLGRFC